VNGFGAARVDTDRAWWSRRWMDVLDAAGPAHARRVQRGEASARRGQVEDLDIARGVVRGRVREDRVSPYRVTLGWPAASDGAWADAVAALGAELRFTAAILDGDLPEDAADTFAAAGVPLTPTPDALERSCTCTEPTSWCRHVAAVHTAAGLAFARDPFLLLGLRGRSRDELLRALRADRGDPAAPAGADLDLRAGMFAARADLDAVPLAPHPVRDPSALLRQLGEPPGVDDDRAFVEAIDRAAETAWRLAAGEGAEAADEELLLAELRAQRTASAPSLAQALARDEAGVGEQLDALFAAGTVLRTGNGDRARYRAP
jgi:uncharacterized Zn finger protein